MKLANFVLGGESHFAMLTDKGLLDLSVSGETGTAKSLPDALNSWDESLAELVRLEKSLATWAGAPPLRPKSGVKFLPPVFSPSKILLIFVNYKSHGQEVGSAPSEPVFFFKHSHSIVGDGDDVIVPKFSAKPDHEVELGVVIGKRGKSIKPSEAYDHVAGYTVVNDVSFRDGMKRGVEGTVLGRNLFKGKVADTALPMGPWLVTADEVGEPYPLRLTLRVNGEVRQDGTTDDMIFRIPELIANASEDNTLLPGDIIATGTPSGVGLYTGKFLNDRDAMEAEVERIGTLRNTVRFQKP